MAGSVVIGGSGRSESSTPASRMRARRRRSAVLAIAAATLLLLLVGLIRGTGGASTSGTTADANGPSSGSVASPARGQSSVVQPSPVSVPGGPVDRTVVKKGDGTFTTAAGGSSEVGQGTILKYKVETEQGTGVNAAQVASFVDQTLADPRSWIAGKKWGFQRISSGKPDFTVKLSSPDTVDKLCAPLTTDGYASCRKGDTVVVNTDRWTNAVKAFHGDYLSYRHYVVNHEIGHRLGLGHMDCPRKGTPAPVMMQQTYGLKGCTVNGWPYVDGRLIKGPSIIGQ